MSSSAEQVRHAVSRISHDLQATLGWEPDRSEAEALREAQSVAAWDFDGFYPASAYPLKVVEAVQQWLHDTFEHTTWPPCPRHLWHPLWLDDAHNRLVWRCTRDDVDVAPLGSLALLPK